MIIAKNTFATDGRLRAHICVVGGGPAAIALAMRLAAPQRTVIMLAGGGWSETAVNQDLHRGIVEPPGSHEPLEENRRRQFGGASTVWGGRCLPFEPIDFMRRDWVPNSGWPICYESLLPYYQQAAKLCDIGDFQYCAHDAFPDGAREIIAGLDSAEIVSDRLERWSPPVNFAEANKTELTSHASIRVLLDAHALFLAKHPAIETVGSVRVMMQHRPLTVEADYFVLASGGIENPRLLLLSEDDRFPGGLGNEHDNVGRYYMAHLNGTFAELTPNDASKVMPDFERDSSGVYCRRRWWLSEAVQRRLQLLNIIFFLDHSRGQNGHRDVLFSSRYIAKTVLSIARQKSLRAAVRQGQDLAPALREHSVNVARNGLRQAPTLFRLAMQRAAKRRLPFVLPSRQNKSWGLYFQSEHAPRRDSRVTLAGESVDAFGMRRARVEIAFGAELDSVVRAHALFVDNFRQRGLGSAECCEADLRRYLEDRVRGFNSAAHHLGTTRMSEDPRTGVVDSKSRVHGLQNLYIAGSSVFPTGSHANPTLTIVAHALMLADHLTDVCKGS